MSSACPRRSRAGSRSVRGRASARRTGAIQGFLKSAGLARIEDATIETDPKKGEFYVAVIEKPGRATREVLAEILPAIVRGFPWPKSMRWGAASARPERAALGAAAARDRLHVRRRARGAGDRALRGRRHRGRRRHLRPSLPGAGARFSVRRFDDYVDAARQGQGRARRATGARRSSSPTRRAWRSPTGSNWSRTRGCSTKSPAWSNGRSC